MKRRERTRHLIELGGLVVKSGLVELTKDDRAMIYGGLLDLTLQLQPEVRNQVIAVWKRRGALALKEGQELREDRRQQIKLSEHSGGSPYPHAMLYDTGFQSARAPSSSRKPDKL